MGIGKAPEEEEEKEGDGDSENGEGEDAEGNVDYYDDRVTGVHEV